MNALDGRQLAAKWRRRVMAVTVSYIAFGWCLLDYEMFVQIAMREADLSRASSQMLVGLATSILIGLLAGIIAAPGDQVVSVPIVVPPVGILVLEYLIMLSERGPGSDGSGLLIAALMDGVAVAVSFMSVQALWKHIASGRRAGRVDT